MAVTITRTAWTDDDGSGTTGTVLNNAVKTSLYAQIDAALAAMAVSPTFTGTITAAAMTLSSTLGVLGALTLGTASSLIFDDASGVTAQGVVTHESSSPFRLLRYLSKGLAGAWQGAHYFDVSYNAGTSFSALKIVANVDGTTATIVLPTYTAATWVSGDKYLVVDASGNIHRSAVGPGS